MPAAFAKPVAGVMTALRDDPMIAKVDDDHIRLGEVERRDGAARRILRNAGALISGKAAGAVLSLAYLSIAARTLGPTQFGYLALASAYAFAAAGVARFQSWQAVIRFGAPMAEETDWDSLKALLRFTIKLDLASAIFGVALALAFVGFATERLGWPEEARALIYLYCLAVPFLISATPVGILRLFDRFDVLRWQLLITPLVRFSGVVLAWAMNGGIAVFLATWVLSGILDGMTLWWLGWRELRRRAIVPDLFGRPASPAPRSWLAFMIKSNAASTLDLARDGLPMLMVGGVLGGAASGFLQIAINLTNLIAQPANMLSQAILPELTKTAMVDGRAAMRRLAYKTMIFSLLAAAPLVLLFIVFRKEAVAIAAGDNFAPAAAVLAMMAAAQLFRVSSFVVEAASLALGRAGVTLVAQSIAAALQLAVLAFAIARFGVLAVPAALAIGYSVIIATHVWRLNAR